MSQKRQYKQYTKEFKEEAVALITEQGYSVPEAAKSLWVNANLLYRSHLIYLLKWKQLLTFTTINKGLRPVRTGNTPDEDK